MFHRGLQYLTQALREHASIAIVYRRRESSVELRAVVGRTDWAAEETEGPVIAWEGRDYLIEAADLVLDGEVTTPKRGDLIEEVRDEATLTYAVLAPPGADVWRYSDPQRVRIRVHTKQVSA